jgi:hypothetical protein
MTLQTNDHTEEEIKTCGAVIIGARGSSKEMCILNILKKFNSESMIYIFTNGHEPIYDYLQDTLQERIFISYGGYNGFLNFVQQRDEHLPANNKSVMIFDNMELERDKTEISNQYIYKYKFNCSTFYLSPRYSIIPPSIRHQFTLFFVVKVDKNDFKYLTKEAYLGVTNEQLHGMYEYMLSKSGIGNFLMINPCKSKISINFSENLLAEDF